jgi:hypothetical protein
VSRDIFSYILKLSQHDISSLNFIKKMMTVGRILSTEDAQQIKREEISKLCYKNHTMLLTIKSIEQHSSIMWSVIIVVVSLASATSAQVFGIGGCPTVTPQANFDLQQVSTGCKTTI